MDNETMQIRAIELADRTNDSAVRRAALRIHARAQNASFADEWAQRRTDDRTRIGWLFQLDRARFRNWYSSIRDARRAYLARGGYLRSLIDAWPDAIAYGPDVLDID